VDNEEMEYRKTTRIKRAERTTNGAIAADPADSIDAIDQGKCEYQLSLKSFKMQISPF
jgi:hypothetical protein